jgi:hypothetical protein
MQNPNRAMYNIRLTPPSDPHFPVRLQSFAQLTHSWRFWLPALLALLACGAMIRAAFFLRAASPDELLDHGVAWALLGTLIFGVALWAARGRPVLAVAAPTVRALEGRVSGRFLIPGLILIALVTELSAKLLGIDALYNAGPAAQFGLFCAGLVLLARGLGGAFPRPTLRGWRGALPLLGILVLALVIRLIWLDSSVHTLIDESQDLSGMQFLWTHPTDGLLKAASIYLPTTMVYSYWETVAVDLFGRTLFALRFTNALVGVLTVFSLYLLAKALFDRTTALVAAMMLATFPPAIHFSRVASAYAGTLFGTLALAFAVRGLRENRRLDWALCGLMFGLTQYFYEASRLLFPPLIVIWLVMMLVLSRRHLRAQWRGIATALAGALIVAAPVYAVIAAERAPLTSRLDDVGLSSDYWSNLLADGISPQERDALAQHLVLPLEMIVHQPELATYYGGDQPLIQSITLPIWLLGIAFALWRARTPALLLILWVLAIVAGNGLLSANTQYPRYVDVFPALALLVALGLRSVVSLALGQRLWRWQVALLVIAVAAIGAVRIHYYFAAHLPLYNAQVRDEQPNPDATDAIFRAVALPAPAQVVFISDPAPDRNIPISLWGYLTNPPIVPPPDNLPLPVTPAEVTPGWLAALPRDRDYAFFVAPGDTVTVEKLQSVFTLSGPEYTTHDEIPPDKRFVMYTTLTDQNDD